MADKSKRRWRIVHSESSTGWGGQERRILAELTGLRRRGSDVWLLAPAGSQISQEAAKRGVPAYSLTVNWWQLPVTVVRIAGRLRQLRPEVLNTHSSRDGWIAGMAGRLARVPFLVRTRHFDVPIPNHWLSRHVYETLADHLLTTSPMITDHFQRFFQWPDDRVSTVPTGVDLELFSPAGPVAALWPSSERSKPPLVGIISILRRAKGHSILLEAMRRLRDDGFAVNCVIVGDGPMRSMIEQEVGDRQLRERVVMTGHRDDIPDVLRALDLLVIPSRHEGIPQIGLQALAAKTPVIGSSVGGIPSIIRHGDTGRLVPPEDPGALAQAIREALQNVQATRAMSERGRAFVEAHHSLEAMLDTLEALYRRYLPPA